MGGGPLTRRLGQLPVSASQVAYRWKASPKENDDRPADLAYTKGLTGVFSQDMRIVSPWRAGAHATLMTLSSSTARPVRACPYRPVRKQLRGPGFGRPPVGV